MRKIIFVFFAINLSSLCLQAQERQKVYYTNFKFLNKISSDTVNYTFKVQQLPNSTYGYTIYANDQPYLRQLAAPGKAGNLGFSSEESALKAIRIIIYKLEHPVVPPTLSNLEMQHLGID